MKKLAVIGPFNDVMRSVLESVVPENFALSYIAEEEKIHEAYDADYVILRTFRLDKTQIEHMRNLRMIQRWGAGYDSVDIAAAGERGIPVATAPGANAFAVAELAILLMLAVYRKLIPLHNGMREGKWRRNDFVDQSYMLHGKTAGIVGLGFIGRLVAERMRSFGVTLQYYDVFRLSEEEEKQSGISYVPFEELLKTSDILSLHLPLSDKTRNILNRSTLALMKPTAIVINTSRGGLIDEEALYEAIRDGKLLGAGLDCHETEPPEKPKPLYELDGVAVTCHTGGNTVDLNEKLAAICFENLLNFDAGKPINPRCLVNGHLLKRQEKEQR
jgi:phosphoglycerate dehydrogenase-like enzyme